jgi:hypothetical protein
MRDQIDNATAAPNVTTGGLPKRDASAPTNVTLRCNVAPACRPAALRVRWVQRPGRLEVIVFLVDTPVELENAFSLSESTTSPKLSRYTFRSDQDRNPARPDAGRERSNASEGSLGPTQKEAARRPGSRACPPWRACLPQAGYGLSRYTRTLLDTPVEKEIESTLAESATSPKTSRYTFRSDQDRNPARPDAGRERSNTCPPWRASEGSLGRTQKEACIE